jgi:hypothetical protein
MSERFSDRIGATQPTRTLLVNAVSTELRHTAWNWMLDTFGDYSSRRDAVWRDLLREQYRNYFKLPVDSVPAYESDCQKIVKHHLLNTETEWFKVYNYLEHVLQNNIPYAKFARAQVQLNRLLERELSGYRAVDALLVPITNPTEIAAIAEALDTAGAVQLVAEHIHKALDLLGRKPRPDYLNSIKESISAVEGIAKLLTSGKSSGLEGALRPLAAKIDLHPALVQGFLKLYGYTSDADGIRHPILDIPDAGFAEAKFMLVTCSAFVNYITSRATDAGMLTPAP